MNLILGDCEENLFLNSQLNSNVIHEFHQKQYFCKTLFTCQLNSKLLRPFSLKIKRLPQEKKNIERKNPGKLRRGTRF